jgi:hypothetical protein
LPDFSPASSDAVYTPGNNPAYASNASDKALPAHPLVYVVNHAQRARIRDAPTQDVEGLDERHARLEQRRQLLVEHEELTAWDFVPMRQRGKMDAGQRATSGLLNGEDVQPLLLKLPPQPRFAVSDVDAFDNLSAGRAEPAPELHILDFAPILHN